MSQNLYPSAQWYDWGPDPAPNHPARYYLGELRTRHPDTTVWSCEHHRQHLGMTEAVACAADELRHRGR
jgi:hypothetical protein